VCCAGEVVRAPGRIDVGAPIQLVQILSVPLLGRANVFKALNTAGKHSPSFFDAPGALEALSQERHSIQPMVILFCWYESSPSRRKMPDHRGCPHSALCFTRPFVCVNLSGRSNTSGRRPSESSDM
jgi:hypothetical protein